MQSIGNRISSLASTDKLDGFSLSEFFSEVFKKRTKDEIDDYFVVGTSRTTPRIEDVATSWPKPWFFFRVLTFVALIYFGFYFAFEQFENIRLIPGLIMMGSLAVPLATVILFFELNIPRNVSFNRVLMLVASGGVVSLFVALVGFKVSNLNWLGASSAGIVEEIGKLLAVILVARSFRGKYILNGLLFGAAVGAGFAFFESAGYAFDYLERTNSLSVMFDVIQSRAFLTPFGHVAWTAIAAAALWRVKGDRAFPAQHAARPRLSAGPCASPWCSTCCGTRPFRPRLNCTTSSWESSDGLSSSAWCSRVCTRFAKNKNRVPRRGPTSPTLPGRRPPGPSWFSPATATVA